MNRVDDYCQAASPIFGDDHDMGPRSSWRSRGLRDYLLMYTYGGRCRIGWKGGEIVSRPGDFALIAPGVAHDYGTPPGCDRWAVLWVVFAARPSWLEWLQWPGPLAGIGHLAIDDDERRMRVVRHLREAVTLSAAGIPNRDLLAMNALEAVLLWCWNSLGPTNTDPRLRRAVEFICREQHRPIGLEVMARAAGLSRPHFSRLFRQHLGTTPQRFLEDRRLQRACELLRASPMPVHEVAAACGFASAFYFSSRFARRFGLAPRAWRTRA